MLQREGWKIYHERVHRICCEEGLNLRLKGRRKRPAHGRIKLDFICPGRPVENAFVKSFNGRLRVDYNTARPQSRTPSELIEEWHKRRVIEKQIS